MLVNGSAVQKKNLVYLGFVSLVLLGSIIYSNILHAEFFFDDYSSIVDNETIKDLDASLAALSLNRYVTYLTFALNYAVSGLMPFSYHLLNIIIHIVNAFLVYCLVILGMKTPHLINSGLSRQFVAFSSAFIFISHPIQTQAVTYIVQRATSLATMFYLLSLVAYSRWRLTKEDYSEYKAPPEGSMYANAVFYIISFFSAVLAMKTKEIAFTLPVIIVLYEFSFFAKIPHAVPVSGQRAEGAKRLTIRRLLYLLPIILTFLIIPLSMTDFSVQSQTIIQEVDNVAREAQHLSRTDYFYTQLRVLITYIRLLLFPVNQNVDYRYPMNDSLFNLPVFISLLGILFILGIAIYLYCISRSGRRRALSDNPGATLLGMRLIAFGILWFFITNSVESSIIPISDIMVEHRGYLPSVGFIIALVSLTDLAIDRSRLKIIVIAGIVLCLGLGSYSRNELWKDPQKMWEDVVAKAPNNARAYTEIGAILRDEGRYAEANERFEEALRINSSYPLTYFNLGYIQYKLQDYDKALTYFNKTLAFKLSPLIHMDTLNSMGMTYSEMGDDHGAVGAFKAAIQVFPTMIIPYNNLGRQYIKMGEAEMAVEALNKALKIREAPAIYHNLSTAYNILGNKEKAQIMREKALLLEAN